MFQAQIGLIRKLRISAFLAGAFLFLLSGLFVFPMASGVDETQATSKQSETVLTISADDLTLNFEIDSANGSFAEDSADISITTNNITGYTLSINTGNTGDNAGKLVGENQSFNPISSATSETDFTNSADYNGLWGYKPSKVNGETNTSYLPAPTETTTIEETDAPNNEANVYEIGLGARADMSYEAGGYTNTFVITGVANPVGYSITYDKNIDGTVTNMPEPQSGITAEQTVTLRSNTPEKDGYNFLSWCDGTVSGNSCNGTVYQPGDNYEINQVDSSAVVLLAVWNRPLVTFDMAYAAAGKTKDATSDKYLLQDMTPAICNAVTDEETTTLVDIRDGRIYNVVKGLDHRCWLADNLALNLLATSVQSAMENNPSYTNATPTTINALFHGGRAGGDSSTNGLAKAGVTGEDSYYYARPRIVNWFSDMSSGALDNPTDTLAEAENWKFGNLYNFCAASAGSYCYDFDVFSDPPVNQPNTAVDAMYDICPANWRLPTSGLLPADGGESDGGEYELLYNAYPSNSTDTQNEWFRKVLRLPLAGRFANTISTVFPSDMGNSSDFWSSTYYGQRSSDLYSVNIYQTSRVEPHSFSNRTYWESVRCIAVNSDAVEYSINYNKNTEDEVGNLPAAQAVDTNIGSAVSLSGNTPARGGYRFAGWCDGIVDANGCVGETYRPNDNYEIRYNAGETINLYAIWSESTDPPGTEGGSINDNSSKWQANSLLRAFELAYVEAGYPMYIEDSTVTAPIPGWRPMTREDEATIGNKETRFAMQDISLTFTENNVTQGVCEWAAPSLADNTYIDEAIVMDKRDGKSYWVLKAADGRCWMTQNLDFDIPTTALTSDTTDLTQYGTGGYTSENGYSSNDGVISWTPERATIPASSISSTGVISGWTNMYNDPYSVNTGDWYWIGNWNDNGTDTWYSDTCASAAPWCNYLSGNEKGKFSNSPYVGNGEHGHVGNYYNWPAAIASNDSSSYSSDTIDDVSGNPQNSICPAGWRLPTISNASDVVGSTNEFKRLTTLYGNTISNDEAFTASPLWFVRGGYVNGSGLYYSGHSGHYWSSTVYGIGSSRPLNFQSNMVSPVGLANNSNGEFVRCVARDVVPADPDPNITTFDEAFAAANKTKDTTTSRYKMQDMNTSICNAVTTPTASDYSDTQETQLVDIRDGKVYWVSKLMDGHCWMTQNLDLDLETTPNHVLALTSENTDLNVYGSNGYDFDNGYSKDSNDVITWTPERATIPTSSISSSGTVSGWSNDVNRPYSVNTGDWYWIGNWKDNGTDTWYSSIQNNYLAGNVGDNPVKFKKNEPFLGNGEHGHVGNHYNWSAAIASNRSSSFNAPTISSDMTRNPQNSICPAGWRLPTISNASDTVGSTNEFQRLITLYGNNTTDDKTLTASPLWFVRGGYFYEDELSGSGYGSAYWSSTVNNGNYAFGALSYSDYVNPTNGSIRYSGRPVRCVAR